MKKMKQEELNIFIDKHNLYLESIDGGTKGKRLILDEIDFSDNDLTKLNFLEVYITDSFFGNIDFINTNFGGAELYSCCFKDAVFQNVNFGKTALDYATIKNSKFYNCKLQAISTKEAVFDNLILEFCEFNDAFSFAKISQTEFIDSRFHSIDFWQCIIDNLIFKNMHEFSIKNLVEELNIGTFDEAIIICKEEAANFFLKKCAVV